MNKYLANQLKLHPFITSQDVLKMAYQIAFGAEHLVDDFSNVQKYLFNEFSETKENNEALFEEISDYYVRVNLGAWKKRQYDPNDLWKLFYDTLKRSQKEDYNQVISSFKETLKVIWNKEEYLAFEKYFENYQKDGIRAVSHSQIYKDHHHPHYRLINKQIFEEYLSQKG